MRHSPKARSRGPAGRSQRQLRVGELVRHALADIATRDLLADPALDGLIITVSEVRVSPDLKHATAFVAPLGGSEADMDRLLAGLKRCQRFLRGELGRRIETKFTPELHFEADRSFAEAERINTLLRSEDVARDLDAADGDADDPDETEGTSR